MKDMLGKSGFDVIGDVHGHAAELTILFKRMGYQETNGVLRHPEGRRVVFLGDFIDRGPEIRRTLKPENRGIYTQSDSSKKSSRNIRSLAVVSVDKRY